MRIVHTSDWHAGRVWKGKKRLPELAAALDHLADYAAGEKVDLLLVTGDVFDSGAPAAEAAPKVAVVDLVKVMRKHPQSTVIEEKFKQARKDAEDNLESSKAQLEELKKKIESMIEESPDLTDAERLAVIERHDDQPPVVHRRQGGGDLLPRQEGDCTGWRRSDFDELKFIDHCGQQGAAQSRSYHLGQ